MEKHRINAEIAKQRYVEDKYRSAASPANARADWAAALRMSRRLVADALRQSDYLRDVSRALQVSGAHMHAYRHMIAPPISQDQFKLLCPPWPKSSEVKGTRVRQDRASDVAAAFYAWLDPALAPWLKTSRKPTTRQVRELLNKVSGLIATKLVDTAQRNRLSAKQESEVVDILAALGWTQLASNLVDYSAIVPEGHFMNKTRFSSGGNTHQEVDIACGLPKGCVLAMECKVSNDPTNSVKRVNDVIKKAANWQRAWGMKVKTAALLEGVIKAENVQELSEANIHVFWSHDLGEFKQWLLENT